MWSYLEERARLAQSIPYDFAFSMATTGSPTERALAATARPEPDILESLAHDDAEAVRVAVAGNVSITPEIVTCMVRDEAKAVRATLCSNPALGTEAIRTLSKDLSWEVRRACAYWAPTDLATHLSTDENSKVRWAAAVNPLLPKEVQEHLAENDSDSSVRQAAELALFARAKREHGAG